MIQTILERFNKTQIEIAQIEYRKQEEFVRLQEKYKTTDTIADCGGAATAIFIGILISCLVFCDLLKLLTYCDVFKRKNLKRPDLANQIEENQNPKGIRYVYKNSIEDILILSERRTISSIIS